MRPALLLTLLLAAAPVNASSLVRSAENFCSALQTINRKGVSTKPGSAAATLIARNANLPAYTYQEHWELVRTLVPWCRSVW